MARLFRWVCMMMCAMLVVACGNQSSAPLGQLKDLRVQMEKAADTGDTEAFTERIEQIAAVLEEVAKAHLRSGSREVNPLVFNEVRATIVAFGVCLPKAVRAMNEQPPAIQDRLSSRIEPARMMIEAATRTMVPPKYWGPDSE